jgi:tripartite-type tricarboxylate transporter receptor subunit TctC
LTVLVVAVHPSVPANSVKQLIALAKARPGELNYSSASVASPGHLAAELFKSMASFNIVHVPYKGNISAITALVSGEVQVMFTDSGLLMPHVSAGKLPALAVSSAEPSALVPGLPTVAAPMPGYESVGVSGFWAPAKTPTAIVNRLTGNTN